MSARQIIFARLIQNFGQNIASKSTLSVKNNFDRKNIYLVEKHLKKCSIKNILSFFQNYDQYICLFSPNTISSISNDWSK